MKERSRVDLKAVSKLFRIRKRKGIDIVQMIIAAEDCTAEHLQYEDGSLRLHVSMNASN